MLPDDDAKLLSILIEHLTMSKTRDDQKDRFTVSIIDTGDGNGAGFIELSDELLVSLGWRDDDLLSYEIKDSGGLYLT